MTADVPGRLVGLHRRERLVAVELGHEDVEQHDVDVAGVRAHEVEGLGPVLGLQRLEAERRELADQDEPVDAAVVDDEGDPGRAHRFAALQACSAAAAASQSPRIEAAAARASSASSAPERPAISSVRAATDERHRPERRARRLQRVRGTHRGLRIPRRDGRLDRVDLRRAVGKERLDELDDEGGVAFDRCAQAVDHPEVQGSVVEVAHALVLSGDGVD